MGATHCALICERDIYLVIIGKAFLEISDKIDKSHAVHATASTKKTSSFIYVCQIGLFKVLAKFVQGFEHKVSNFCSL